MARQRPWVIWKFGATMDGRIAAQDTSSKWITSDAARADAQQIRAQVDAIMVGTNTVLIDNPALTVRTASVTEPPLRVIVGRRELSSDLQIFDSAAETVQLSGTPAGVLQQLQQRGVQKILLEGGPTLAAAFLAAGYIDEIVGYLAPKFLGSGANLIADLGINNVQAALTLEVAQVQLLPGEPNNIKVILQKVN